MVQPAVTYGLAQIRFIQLITQKMLALLIASQDSYLYKFDMIRYLKQAEHSYLTQA